MSSALATRDTTPDLAIILPTYNERDNVPVIIALLTATLDGLHWEAIFVDDDSPDGTHTVIAAHARLDSRIRLVHRTGQRGLASACTDGILATRSPFVAIMDADLQHDPTILPRMLSRLHAESLDLIIATRNSDGGSMGQFSPSRVLLSRLGQRLGATVCHRRVSDPMSGFFMFRRSLVVEVLPRLRRNGFKILVDILASSPATLRVGEIGYTFQNRHAGQSKLNLSIGFEYLSLILNKLMGEIVSSGATLPDFEGFSRQAPIRRRHRA